jgi:hypothetical protein
MLRSSGGTITALEDRRQKDAKEIQRDHEHDEDQYGVGVWSRRHNRRDNGNYQNGLTHISPEELRRRFQRSSISHN